MSRESLSDLTEEFAAIRANQGYADHTVQVQRLAHQRLAKWYDKQRRSPRNLTEQDLERYLFGPEGRATQVSTNSFNTEITQLRVFLRWCVQMRGVVKPSVLAALQPKPADKHSYHRASQAQIEQMVTNCTDPWERWVLALASQTLGRESELIRLRFADFKVQTSEIAWYRQKTRDTDFMPITRILHTELLAWKRYLQDAMAQPLQDAWHTIPRRLSSWASEGVRWAYYPDKPRTKELSPVIKRHASRALGVSVDALKGEGVHLVRRSMARALFNRLAEAGEPDPLGVVQAMLGHQNRKTTETYIGLEHGRHRRNQLLSGSDLLWTPNENVAQLRREA